MSVAAKTVNKSGPIVFVTLRCHIRNSNMCLYFCEDCWITQIWISARDWNNKEKWSSVCVCLCLCVCVCVCVCSHAIEALVHKRITKLVDTRTIFLISLHQLRKLKCHQTCRSLHKDEKFWSDQSLSSGMHISVSEATNTYHRLEGAACWSSFLHMHKYVRMPKKL